MRRLQIMRHAKSDWTSGARDHDRPLNGRGVKAARAMGIALRRLGETPDLVVSSSALRARTTAELAAATGGWKAHIETDPSLYGGGVREALETAAAFGGRAERLMLVGHQPTWGALVAHLTNGVVQMKTATVAAVDCLIRDWADLLEPSPGELAYLLQARMLADVAWEETDTIDVTDGEGTA